jgi:class 3 adenylate cyclase
MRRKLLGVFGFAIGILAGSVVYRRSFARRRDRVDIYFGDGSMVSFAEGSPEADKLIPVAREALAAAHRPQRRT